MDSDPVLDTSLNSNEHSMTYPGQWTEQSVLTISLDDEGKGGDKKIRYFVLLKAYQHMLLIVVLATSASFIILSISLLNHYGKDDVSFTVWKCLLLLRYIGIYSFSGGVCTFLSIEMVFHASRWRFGCIRSHHKRIMIVKRFLEAFIKDALFEERFLSQYLKRARNLDNTEETQTTLSFMESNQFEDWITSRWLLLKQSPEGLIIDSLGLDPADLKKYFRTVLFEALYECHEIHLSSSTDKREYNSHIFRKHVKGTSQDIDVKNQISNILSERLTFISDNTVHTLFIEIIQFYIDHVVAVSSLLMAVIGALIGVVTEFT